MENLIASTQGGDTKITEFDCSVFDGKYVTGDVDQAYLNRLEQARNDDEKIKTGDDLVDTATATNMQSKM